VNGSHGESRAASAGKTGIVSIVDLLVLCHDRAGEVRTYL